MVLTKSLWVLLVLPVLQFHGEQINEPVTRFAAQPDTVKNGFKQEAFKEVPVLCYHQIRDWRKTDSKNARSYITSPQNFKRQIALLRDSGYHFILPDDLLAYNQGKIKLPQKTIILSFDDATASQYTAVVPELNRYNIKAVFFVMTVVLNRPGYMTSLQVKTLADQGHIIGCHTWDHHDVRQYSQKDWKLQLSDPTKQLEKITGKPVHYFAYPYGTWNRKAVETLQQHGFYGAFQLAGRQDVEQPGLTIRRLLVNGYWNEYELLKATRYSFK